MRELVLTQTGNQVDIMLDKDTFKSTYQIMVELAEVWDRLNDAQQAYLAEKLAGKHRGSIFMGLMRSGELLEDVLDTSLESSGSAMREHDKRMESIESHINQLKVAWEDLSRNTLSSEFVIGVVDMLTAIVKLIDKVGILNLAIGALGIALSVITKHKIINSMAIAAVGVDAVGNTAAVANQKVKLFSLGLKALGKIALPFLVVAGVLMLVEAFDAAFVSLEEHAEKIADLEAEYKELGVQYDELNNKVGKTDYDKEKLKYLDLELKIKKETLEIEKEQYAHQMATGDWITGQKATYVAKSYVNQAEYKENYEDSKKKVDDLNRSLAEKNRLLETYDKESAEYHVTATSIDKLEKDLKKSLVDMNKEYGKAVETLGPMVDYRNDLNSALENASDADKEEIKNAMAMLDAYIDKQQVLLGLVETMEDYKTALADATGLYDAVADVTQKINDGYKWSQGEIDALCQKYPQLQKIFQQYVNTSEDGTILLADALVELGIVSEDAQRTMIQSQIKITESTIEQIKKRLQAYETEISFLQKISDKNKERRNSDNALNKFMGSNREAVGTDSNLTTGKEDYDAALKDYNDELGYLAELQDQLRNLGTNKGTGNPISYSSDDKKNSGKTAKIFGIDTKAIIDDILTMDDAVVKALEDTQTKIENAVLYGDSALETTLQDKVSQYYNDQLSINKQMVDKLSGEIDGWVKQLSGYNYGILSGIDIKSITTKQLGDISTELDKMIDKASVAGKDSLEQSLNRQKTMIEDLCNGIITANEELGNLGSSALALQNEQLQHNIDLIGRKLELEQQIIDEKNKQIEIEQILLEEGTQQYNDFEVEKYNNILKSQQAILKAINDYRRQGLQDTSNEINSLKNQWYDYESERLNTIKSFREKRKELEEKYKSEYESLEKEMQSTLGDIMKDGLDKRKAQLDKELSQYTKAIDDVLKKMDRDNASKDFGEQQEEQTKTIIDLESEIAKYKLASADGDASAKLKVSELEAKLAEERKKLVDLQYDREQELRKEQLNDSKDKAEEDTENKKEELDQQYKDAMENLENTKDLVDLTSQEITNILESFFNTIGVSADNYGSKIDNLIDKQRELGEIQNQIGMIDGMTPDFGVNDGDASNPNINNGVITEKEAKKQEQLKQAEYLHQKRKEAIATKNKGLEQWVMSVRPDWGLDAQTGSVVEEGKIPDDHWRRVKSKYGFYRGGQTQQTGWHWLDGNVGKPEEVLNAIDTKYWREMVDLSPDFLKAMKHTGAINENTTMVPIEIGTLINIEGNVNDESIIPKINNSGKKILEEIAGVMKRRGI